MLASGEGGGALEGEGHERWAEWRRQNTDCRRRPSIFLSIFLLFHWLACRRDRGPDVASAG